MTWGIFFIIGIIVIIAGTVWGVVAGIKEDGMNTMVIVDAIIGMLCSLILVMIVGGLLYLFSVIGSKSIF